MSNQSICSSPSVPASILFLRRKVRVSLAVERLLAELAGLPAHDESGSIIDGITETAPERVVDAVFGRMAEIRTEMGCAA